jgi:C1A family cysteine protease
MKKLFLFLLCTPLFAVTVRTYSLTGLSFIDAVPVPVHAKGLKFQPVAKGRKSLKEVRLPVPKTLDYSSQIYPAGDQGQFGTCYAWATAEALSNQLRIKGKDAGFLSPQFFMDASGDGNQGGWLDVAQFATSPKGAPLLSTYPYTGKNEKLRSVTIAGQSYGWNYVGDDTNPPTIGDLQSALFQYGPLAIVMDASNPDFQYYSSGVFNECPVKGNAATPDHAVLLLGWDDAGNWIALNSWGLEWGMKGVFKMPFGCGIAQEAAFFLPKHR